MLKLVRREPNVDLQLINRLQELAGTERSLPQTVAGQRRLSELDAIATTIEKKRTQKERNAARKERVKELEALALREADLWQRVIDLIALKQGRAYDEAIILLQDLHDLKQHQGQLPVFVRRLERFKLDYSNRPALIKRFRTINL